MNSEHFNTMLYSVEPEDRIQSAGIAIRCDDAACFMKKPGRNTWVWRQRIP